MPDVFDKDGKIIKSPDNAVFNDLTRAPVHATMPDGPSWLAVIVPAEGDLKRIVLVDPDQIATMQSIQDIIDAVTVARQALVDQVLAKNAEQDAALTAMAQEVAQIALTPGPQGERGPTGPKGADGSVGPKGDTGQQGLVGPVGSKGDQGAKGDKGDTGSQGSTGAKGDQGIAGVIGPKGNDGASGAVGATGAKGDTGSTGSQGSQGPKGDAGTPTRVERYTTFSTDANGIVTIIFSTPFTALPDCDIVESWTAEAVPRMICGSCYDVTLTGCKAQVMMSQGTLLLNTSPFSKAAAGIKPVIRAMGK